MTAATFSSNLTVGSSWKMMLEPVLENSFIQSAFFIVYTQSSAVVVSFTVKDSPFLTATVAGHSTFMFTRCAGCVTSSLLTALPQVNSSTEVLSIPVWFLSATSLISVSPFPCLGVILNQWSETVIVHSWFDSAENVMSLASEESSMESTDRFMYASSVLLQPRAATRRVSDINI